MQQIHQYFHLFQANSVIGVVPDSKFAGNLSTILDPNHRFFRDMNKE